MAKLQIVYEATQEIDQLIKNIEQQIDLKKDEKENYEFAQKLLQSAFDEGRKFQKQLSLNSNAKDSVCFKAEI